MNNKSSTLKCQILVLLFYTGYFTSAEENASGEIGIDILLLGPTGSGKSSTLNMLFDRVVTVNETNNNNDMRPTRDLVAYTIVDNDDGNNFIRFIDTPGLGSTKGVVHETRVLATIKKYLRESKNPPAIILIFSKFDDNRFSGEKSNFVQMLKKYNGLEKWYNPPEKIPPKFIFVFTHVQGITIREQRNPKNKIGLFADIIRNHTTFPNPIVVTLAENEAEDEELEIDEESGSYKLLNGDLYPQNLIDNIMSALETNYNETDVEAFKRIFDNRKTLKVNSRQFMRVLSLENIPNEVGEELKEKLKPSQRLNTEPPPPTPPTTTSTTESSSTSSESTTLSTTDEIDNLGNQNKTTVNEFQTTMMSVTIEEESAERAKISNNTESSSKTQNSTRIDAIPDYDSVFDEIDDNLKSKLSPEKLEILRNKLKSNIGVRRTKTEIVDFFHSLELNEEEYTKLESLLKVQVSELDLDDPIVGYGYNILMNIPTANTPFENENFEFSSLGFKIPEILHSYNINPTVENTIQEYYPSLPDFLKTRLRNLNLENVKIDPDLYKPNFIEGYNIKNSWGNDDTIKITAVREFKNFNWILKEENLVLNKDFLETLSDLPTLSLTSRESVTEWASLFETYGTHIVSMAYGGGSVETHFHIDISKIEELKSTKTNLNSFIPVPDYFNVTSTNPLVHKTDMRFNGGLYRKRIENLNNLSPAEAKSIYDSWVKSLSTEPIILESNLFLKSLSEVIEKENPGLSLEMKKASDLFLAGKLVYTKAAASTTPVTTAPTTAESTTKVTTTTEPTTTTVVPSTTVAPTITTTQKIQRPINKEVFQKPTQSTPLPIPPTKITNTRKSPPNSTLANICGRVKGNFDFVGHGYNIQHRVAIKKSPFESIEHLKTCHDPPNNKRMDISYTYEVFEDAFHYNNYLTHYIKKISPTENVLIGDKFMSYCTKTYPPGMNAISSSLMARSWLEEFTILSQELSVDLSGLSSEFVDLVDSLPTLDARVAARGSIPREVLKVWISFFNTYGTHVIQFADIGGALKITLNKEIWNRHLYDMNYASQMEKENLFKTITDKRKFRFIAIGGDNSEIYMSGLIPQAISKWQDSLFERPALLQSKLKLIPIVKLVTYVRPILQKTAEALMKVVYSGSAETLEEVYRERNGLRQQCDLDHWNACYQNSKCMRNGRDSVCLCDKDFKESNGECFLPNWSSPCNFRLECNHHQGFNCVMGYCKCLMKNSYHTPTNSCLSRARQMCGWWIVDNEREWHHTLCHDGLHCSNTTRGFCYKYYYHG